MTNKINANKKVSISDMNILSYQDSQKEGQKDSQAHVVITFLYPSTVDCDFDIFYKNTLVGRVVALDILDDGSNYYYTGVIYSRYLEISIGINQDLVCVKRDHCFYPEYMDKTITPSGAYESLEYQDSYEFIPVLEKDCLVNSGDLLGYLKHGDRRFPVLLGQEFLQSGLMYNVRLKNNFKPHLSYFKSINKVLDEGVERDIMLSGQVFDVLPELSLPQANEGLSIVGNHDNSELFKFIHNTDIILYVTANKGYYEIQDFKTSLKDYLTVQNAPHIDFISFSNYPYFVDDYEMIILDKVETYIKLFLHQGYQVLAILDGLSEKNNERLAKIQGMYKTKVTKNSSFKVVKILD